MKTHKHDTSNLTIETEQSLVGQALKVNVNTADPVSEAGIAASILSSNKWLKLDLHLVTLADGKTSLTPEPFIPIATNGEAFKNIMGNTNICSTKKLKMKTTIPVLINERQPKPKITLWTHQPMQFINYWNTDTSRKITTAVDHCKDEK